MATTTNYGWDTPDDTDLVKDGALAMRDLGGDIDTTLYTINAGSGKVGSHLINTTTFTTSSAVTLDGIFTSTYDNYALVLNYTATNNGVLYARFRNGSGDVTGSNYYWGGFYIPQTSTASVNGENGGTVLDYCRIALTATSGQVSGTVSIYQPNVSAAPTQFISHHQGIEPYSRYLSGSYAATGAMTGIKIYPNAGTITGTVRVYGLRNS